MIDESGQVGDAFPGPDGVLDRVQEGWVFMAVAVCQPTIRRE